MAVKCGSTSPIPGECGCCISDGTNTTVTGTGTTADPFIIDTANPVSDSLVDNGDRTYTHTAVNGTSTLIRGPVLRYVEYNELTHTDGLIVGTGSSASPYQIPLPCCATPFCGRTPLMAALNVDLPAVTDNCTPNAAGECVAVVAQGNICVTNPVTNGTGCLSLTFSAAALTMDILTNQSATVYYKINGNVVAQFTRRPRANPGGSYTVDPVLFHHSGSIEPGVQQCYDVTMEVGITPSPLGAGSAISVTGLTVATHIGV